MRVILYVEKNRIKYILYEMDKAVECRTIEECFIISYKQDIVKVIDNIFNRYMDLHPFVSVWKKLFSVELVLRDSTGNIDLNNHRNINLFITPYESMINDTVCFENTTDFNMIDEVSMLKSYYNRSGVKYVSKANKLTFEQGFWGIDTYVENNKSYKVMFLDDAPIENALDRFLVQKGVCFYDEKYFRDHFNINTPQEFQERFLMKQKVKGIFPIITSSNGEEEKNVSTLLHIIDCLNMCGTTRETCVVAFGGGVLSDVVGFAAAIYKRGIQYIKVPTTLIGQVDAGLGIKVGINYTSKNLLGFFYPPQYVLLSNEFIHPLEIEKIECGIAEIIKTAMICDYDLIRRLSRWNPSELCAICDDYAIKDKRNISIIKQAVVDILDVIKCNQYEKGSTRRLFDFGHSFSGILESFQIRHGYAVAIEMLFCCILALNEGYITREYFELLLSMFRECNVIKVDYIDTFLMKENEIFNSFIDLIMSKRDGNLNFVIPVGLGKVGFINLQECSDCSDKYVGIYSRDRFIEIVIKASKNLKEIKAYFD